MFPLPVDGSISRDSLLTPELPQTDEYLDFGVERSSVDSLRESDTAVRLRSAVTRNMYSSFNDTCHDDKFCARYIWQLISNWLFRIEGYLNERKR